MFKQGTRQKIILTVGDWFSGLFILFCLFCLFFSRKQSPFLVQAAIASKTAMENEMKKVWQCIFHPVLAISIYKFVYKLETFVEFTFKIVQSCDGPRASHNTSLITVHDVALYTKYTALPVYSNRQTTFLPFSPF